jgi:hypothetical protein
MSIEQPGFISPPISTVADWKARTDELALELFFVIKFEVDDTNELKVVLKLVDACASFPQGQRTSHIIIV